ncbi:hypothetical protein Tco_0670043 [Tanacetum coccineum]
MGDENLIRTLGDYSKPSHEGYRNTIELSVWNNVVPLRSDTIRLVQNGCSFHELRSEDPNEHLKDFLKLVDSLDLDGENRERTARLTAPAVANSAIRMPTNIGKSLKTSLSTTMRAGMTQKYSPSQLRLFLHLKAPQGTSKTPERRLLELEDQIDFLLKGSRPVQTLIDESWEIIKNLAIYDHEGSNDTKIFAKPVKAISTPQGTSKTLERRLLDLEDHINFLLKGSRPAPTPSSTHTPRAYVEAVYSNSHLQNQSPKLNPFAFRELIEEINGRMSEMFRILKELTTNRAPKKVLIREEAKSPITKSVNSISLVNKEEGKNDIYDVATNDDSRKTDKPDMEVSHRINEKLIEGLIDNNRFNDFLSGARAGKKKGKTYHVLPKGPVYEAILKKKITKK